MDKYKIYCTAEQTKKAFELGASIEFEQTIVHDWSTGKPVPYPDIATDKDGEPILIKPTAEQMIGWLIKEHGILPVIDMANSVSFECGFASMIKMENNVKRFVGIYSSPEEATLAAIDAALGYLENLTIKQ